MTDEHGEPGRHGLGVGAEARRVDQHPVHRRVDLLEDPVLAEGRADRHIAAGQRLGHAHQVRLDARPRAGRRRSRRSGRGRSAPRRRSAAPCAGAAAPARRAGSRAAPRARPCPGSARRRGRRRRRCFSSRSSASRSPSGIGGVGQQRGEAVPEAVLAVDRQRAGGQPVEGVRRSRGSCGLPVAYRANFSAVSTASVPLLPKNTRSRCGLWASSFSASSPGSGWQSKRVRSAS